VPDLAHDELRYQVVGLLCEDVSLSRLVTPVLNARQPGVAI
jgi:hypothetical protein